MKQERKPSPATPATGLRRPLPKTKTQRESAETRCFCCRSLCALASSRVWGQKPPPPPQGKPTALAGSGVDELIQQEEEDSVGRVLHSLLPTASPLTASIPATLRQYDSCGDAAFSPTRRVLKSCRWIRNAVSVPLLQTTTPVTTSCSWTCSSSRTGQMMATSSFSPGSSGPWVAKRSPELVRSMIWPEPVSSGARRCETE